MDILSYVQSTLDKRYLMCTSCGYGVQYIDDTIRDEHVLYNALY